MRSSYDHSALKRMEFEYKATKICDLVASSIEAIDCPNDVSLDDVHFESGNVIVNIVFRNAESLKFIVGTFNPMKTVIAKVGNGEVKMPEEMAQQLNLSFRETERVWKNEDGTISLFSLLEKDEKNYILKAKIKYLGE